jgi:glutathione synthase/RimK-type ligase-like ATP-grasp enzyme
VLSCIVRDQQDISRVGPECPAHQEALALILIVSLKNDLHSLAVRREISNRSNVACHLIESDCIAQQDSVSLRISHGSPVSHCRTAEGQWIDLSEQRVLWLRRPSGMQHVLHSLSDEASKALVQNDCTAAIRGILAVAFHGKWISKYEALLNSSDKIAQLATASRAGWRIPDTLVAQKRSSVVEFFKTYSNEGIVVKTIVGTDKSFLLTRRLTNPLDFEEAAYAASPAIYQECIPGKRHIRLLCFGDRSLAASIDSNDLDWRPNLNVPINDWRVPDHVHRKTRHTLDLLGLEMGVVDLKETSEGELVWLEVNPQGQFLFLDPMTNLRLAENFSRYLIEMSSHRS